jgi:hypothetical protein
MKHILFFSLKDDVLPVLNLVENGGPIRYARMGNFPTREIKDSIRVFSRADEIPNLGQATADSSAASESFLVCDEGTRINVRPVQGHDRVERICVDQLANPDSVTLTPGGIWKDDIVLYGRVATVSESPLSQRLMKRFQAAIRKSFSKIKAYYVGPRALELLQNGKRLTISARSPRGFDLSPE